MEELETQRNQDVLGKIEVEVETIKQTLIDRAKIQLRKEEKLTNKHEEVWMDEIGSRYQNPKDFTKKVMLVVVTPQTKEEYESTDEFKAIQSLIYNEISYDTNGEIQLPLDIRIVAENKRGLSEVYNEFIHIDYSEYYVCFIHDDLTILDTQFFNKIQKYHETYEVLGVAGATQFRLPFREGFRTAWHMLAQDENNVKHMAGSVMHSANDSAGNEKFWTTDFGPTPATGKLIDGLFMSFDVSKCLEFNFQFDNRFNFHHYDLAASLNALSCGFSIGIVPITTYHKGTGDSMNSPEWTLSHRKFVDAFRNYGR